jgi:hypothetical protein
MSLPHPAERPFIKTWLAEDETSRMFLRTLKHANGVFLLWHFT